MSTNTDATESGEGLLSVTDLVRLFEEAEESTTEARKLAERDRDYTDNIQLTSAELETLRKRGQPPVIDNRIKGKVDFLVGLEKTQRVKPKALPRTPVHESDADGATQALRYVTDNQEWAKKRSAVWRNLLVEGAGGIAVSVEPSRYAASSMLKQPPLQMGNIPPPVAGQMLNAAQAGMPVEADVQGTGMQPQELMGSLEAAGDPMPQQPQQQYDIVIRRVSWDRMFADPHSSESDYSDASYLGVVVWMDYADALDKYGEDAKEALDLTLASVAMSDTYDDKPKFNLWADRKRKRVRIVQIWLKRDDEWHFAEFTKCGILKAGPSPYKTDTGESDCELIFQSAYVNRDNERYGLVREMISLQDEVNKRRSKALHLLNTAQIVATEGAVNDIEKTRREAARPDGVIIVNPGQGPMGDRFEFNTRSDLAEGQFKLLQDSKNSIDLKGPNATMQGDKAGGGGSASGKAIIASQQGGMMEIGDLMDGLRDLDRRAFRAVWSRIRQFWTAEKWVRVTDDDRNIKWVGINIDPRRMQEATANNPEAAKKIAGIVGNVAELDCDIIIDEAPDSLTPQLEQFEALASLKQYDLKGELPFRAIVQAAPNLKDKDKILEMMDKASAPPNEEAMAEQQAVKQLEFRGATAKVADTEAAAQLKQASAAKAMRDAQMPPDNGAGPPMQEPPEPYTAEQALADLENTVADTDLKRANIARTAAQTHEARTKTALAPMEFQHRRDDAADRMRQLASRQAPQPAP